MTKYYNKDIPDNIHVMYGGRRAGKYFKDYKVEILEDTPTFKGFKVKDEEIIYKEDKKIDKIKLTNGGLTIHIIVGGVESDYSLTKTERTIIYKLNEIIDHLNVEK